VCGSVGGWLLAVFFSVLGCVAACCSVSQCVAVCGSVADYWQWWSSEYWGCIFVWCLPLLNTQDAQIAAALPITATDCRTATYYTTLHHTATHCNTLQHTPTRYNIHQQVPRMAPARHYTAKCKRQCTYTAASQCTHAMSQLMSDMTSFYQ